MVSELLKSLSAQLKNYSATLDKTNILADKPWALIDGDSEVQKLIFQRDQSLVLSKNGIAQIGSWQYLPVAKSLLIHRSGERILCNEAFIDDAVMVLKLDGTSNKYFLFANENLIPDLDAIGYLKKLRKLKLNILEKKIDDGRILEIQRPYDFELPSVGHRVSIDNEDVADGTYRMQSLIYFIVVRNSLIASFLYHSKFVNSEGVEFVVHQYEKGEINPGDIFYLNGKLISDTTFNFSNWKIAVLQDGILVKLQWKNKFLRFFF